MINSKNVLLKAINKGGSSIRDFKNTLGKQGNFQKEFNVAPSFKAFGICVVPGSGTGMTLWRC